MRGRLALLCVMALYTLVPAPALAQSGPLAQPGPEEGGHEIQIFTGGGHSVPGGTSNTSVWNAGARYGWILTKPFGPGFLKGRFEYTVGIIPVYLIFQKYNTAYGAGFDPLGLKWDFATRGRFAPYLELGGGVLFTNHDAPAGTNDINFTPSAALGTYILGQKYNWSAEIRYGHISNAGLSSPNPGINTVQVRLGLGRFFSSHSH